MVSISYSIILLLITVSACCGFKSSIPAPFHLVKRFQLCSQPYSLEIPTPFGKYRSRYKFVPETLFYVTMIDTNFTRPVLTKKGLVCPILGWREAESRGEMLETAEALKYSMADCQHAYMIPKGTPVPDELLLLQDNRFDLNKEHDRVYFLAPSEPCYPHAFEQLFVDFVLRKNCFRLSLIKRSNSIPSSLFE